MKLKLLSTAIAATFLAGCSSSGSSDNGGGVDPQDGIADVTYFQGENLQAAIVSGDEGNYQASLLQGSKGNTVIRLNGTTYVTNGDEVKNTQGETIGHIQKEGSELVFHGYNGGEAVLQVENGRLIISETIKPGPQLPPKDDSSWDGDHGWDVTKPAPELPPKWDGDEGHTNPFIPVTINGVDYVIDTTTNLVTIDGVVIGGAEYDGKSRIVFTDFSTGETMQIGKDSNGNITIIRGDVDNGWGWVNPDNDLPEFDGGWDNPNKPYTIEFSKEHQQAYVYNEDGKTVLIIEPGDTHGSFEVRLGAMNSDDVYVIYQDSRGEWVIDWEKSTIDGEWGVSPDSEKQLPPSLNDRLITSIESGQKTDGSTWISINDKAVSIIINDGKIVDVNISDKAKKVVAERIELRSDLNAEQIRQKAQSLSQEQRQQIKQAVKDRVSRS
ncbi:hypothetical protein [Vibrio sp. 10N.261.52.A1]|uniref:hypothetical protein n=1 Tax=Vibrio TaxID=662 RepID=UPI000C86789F|nr:hypothetical protein [Vibrio sp. 10N.261.52.A1]PML38555.1 hypothetical protein BCT81_17715 [Vibrio sp. 10N.261.52.A1]